MVFWHTECIWVYLVSEILIDRMMYSWSVDLQRLSCAQVFTCFFFLHIQKVEVHKLRQHWANEMNKKVERREDAEFPRQLLSCIYLWSLIPVLFSPFLLTFSVPNQLTREIHFFMLCSRSLVLFSPCSQAQLVPFLWSLQQHSKSTVGGTVASSSDG